MLSIPFILSIWTVLITCSEPKPHLRHKLPYNLPSGCCRYPGSPSFPRGRERMKSLQTERLSAYGRAYPSYRKKPVRQPCCPDARYGLYRHLKLLRSRACLPIRVLSCTYRLRGVGSGSVGRVTRNGYVYVFLPQDRHTFAHIVCTVAFYFSTRTV